MKRFFYFLLCFALSLPLFVCSSCSQKKTTEVVAKAARPDSVLYAECVSCFDEILSMKSTASFIKDPHEGPTYAYWVKKALSFTDEEKSIVDSLHGFSPEVIYDLGFEYTIHNGKETDKTLRTVKYLYTKFHPLPDTVQVIGFWRITSNLSPQIDSRILVYSKGGSFFYKESHEASGEKIVKLKKSGNKYFDTESTFGEYFLIQDDELKLFDKEGEYAGGVGYTITSLK